MVYVISKDGQPLMPSGRPWRVRRLLRDGKAKVMRRCPFTIKLLYDSTTYTQELTLGVDTGSGTMGAAVADDMSNIVYIAEVERSRCISGNCFQKSPVLFMILSILPYSMVKSSKKA